MSRALELFVVAKDFVCTYVLPLAAVGFIGTMLELARNGVFNDVDKPERPAQVDRKATTVSVGAPPAVR